jgi:uncharacterized membrane protein
MAVRVKALNPSVWASCNVLDEKLGSAATPVLILGSVQLVHQQLVLCAIFSLQSHVTHLTWSRKEKKKKST